MWNIVYNSCLINAKQEVQRLKNIYEVRTFPTWGVSAEGGSERCFTPRLSLKTSLHKMMSTITIYGRFVCENLRTTWSQRLGYSQPHSNKSINNNNDFIGGNAVPCANSEGKEQNACKSKPSGSEKGIRGLVYVGHDVIPPVQKTQPYWLWQWWPVSHASHGEHTRSKWRQSRRENSEGNITRLLYFSIPTIKTYLQEVVDGRNRMQHDDEEKYI